MSIRFKFEKSNLGRLLVAMIFAGVLFVKVSFPVTVLAGFGVFYFLIKNLETEITSPIAKGILTVLFLGGGSIFTTHLIQYLLLDAELRAKITDTKLQLNVLCCLAVYLVIQIFTRNAGLTCMIAHCALMSFAGINYFVYLFRGNEFIFSDLRSAATGLSVAGNYEFVLDDRAAYAVLISALFVALVRKFHLKFEKKMWMILSCAVLAIVSCAYVTDKSQGIVTETWEQKGSYRNGYLLNFALSVRDSFVSPPDGYSKEEIGQLEKQYSGDGDSYVEHDTEKKPTIIVVMSESYSDLNVVGTIRTNEEVTPYFNSLSDNIIRGYALSSVFGAKTPNSEWEFMTGNSMAFLPSGSVVYQQYISDTPTSIVSNLKNIGYTCVAMHPYYETGWSRNAVYPTMGFDEMHFIDYFDQNKILRKYITDQELYEKIIDQYESKSSNEDLFIMSISMQNHGGYTETYDNFNEQIRTLGTGYADANQYLSLLHESDKALEYLISYFENVDDPVEIVFFGDHQPSLNTNFYRMLNGKGLSGLTEDELEHLYTVPFFIWTNYESESKNVEITSFNYLSTLALERAGIALPSYNQFLADMMEVVPAINSRGYYSLTDGCYKHLDEAEGEEAEWISKYEMLQYNNMFDKKGQSKQFFPYLE